MTAPLTPPDEPRIRYTHSSFPVLCFLQDENGNEDGIDIVRVKGRYYGQYFEINDLEYDKSKNFNSIETDVMEDLRGRGFKDFEINVRFPN